MNLIEAIKDVNGTERIFVNLKTGDTFKVADTTLYHKPVNLDLFYTVTKVEFILSILDDEFELVPVKVKKTVYINKYPNGVMRIHFSKVDSDIYVNSNVEGRYTGILEWEE